MAILHKALLFKRKNTLEGIKGVSENIQVFEIGVPNIEAVLKLNPTHLLLSGYTSDLSKYVELENSGVKVINIDTPTSIQGIYDSIELIGKSFNSVLFFTASIFSHPCLFFISSIFLSTLTIN